MLWKCTTSTTVPQFEPEMQNLKEFNEGCYKYLAKIQPHHWARSHFSGRAMSDVLLSNMCEILNRWLVDARDKPIITALEYIREDLMKRIVTVNNMISKSDGPLTPGATKVKWELTAIPCKHAVAALYHMGAFGARVSHLESWVHRVHWLETWKNTYNFKICPLNSMQLWGKNFGTSKLLPPLIVATAGRPKKNRRKGLDEKASMNSSVVILNLNF
ncbi:uncharacterized protein [Rutidosis leptorrhynchoides]|uniref:uncharacterized protein n=1 Tax=Rutidosis leptorrhynchoides TaxID=125765 RepID=UPI003A9A0D46